MTNPTPQITLRRDVVLADVIALYTSKGATGYVVQRVVSEYEERVDLFFNSNAAALRFIDALYAQNEWVFDNGDAYVSKLYDLCVVVVVDV